MELSDYLICKYPLPVDGVEGVNDLEFQTKDTNAQSLDLYEIREDGTLWHQAYDVDNRMRRLEDRATKANMNIRKRAGMGEPYKYRWERVILTGEIRFYSGSFQHMNFSAYFVRGELKHLEPM